MFSNKFAINSLWPILGCVFVAVAQPANAAPTWGTYIEGYLENRIFGPGPLNCTGCGTASYGTGFSSPPVYRIAENTSVADTFSGSGVSDGVVWKADVAFQGSVMPGVMKARGDTFTAGHPRADGNNLLAQSFFSVQLGYFDDILVLSDSLAPGTPVELDITSSFTRSVSATEGTGVDVHLWANAVVVDVYEHHPEAAEVSFGPLTTNMTRRLQSFVGDTIRLQEYVFLRSITSVSSHPSVGLYVSSGAINAGDSVYTYINVVTPGASFASASGASYEPDASAVPEPGTIAYVLLALPFFRAFRRRTVSAA